MNVKIMRIRRQAGVNTCAEISSCNWHSSIASSMGMAHPKWHHVLKGLQQEFYDMLKCLTVLNENV